MIFPKIKNSFAAMAAVILLALCVATPAHTQSFDHFQLPATATSTDGLLTVVLSSTNPTDAVGVDNTYTWTATNNSTTTPLTGVVLGSHWGDYCVGINGAILGTNCPIAPPEGPTLISLAPGCGGQSAGALEFDPSFAALGIWCSPSNGVTLAPGASISGSITIRPRTGGPAYYGVYSSHDPLVGPKPPQITIGPVINYRGMVAPAATDVQITGAASNGSPLVGSTFTYTYHIHNAGPSGTFGGIIFADTLPASLTYVSSLAEMAGIDTSTGQTVQKPSLNACSAVGQTVVCSLQDLTNGGVANQATITLTVAVSGSPQLIVNTASAHTAAQQGDSNLANNSVTVNVASR
jgi:uncharacterized repeat protein (TIGR01451 family)